MTFDEYMPVKIVSGRGCLLKNGKLLSGLGKNCLIVCSATAAKKSGALDDCISVLDRECIDYEIFDGIEQNPKTTTCLDAGKKAAQAGADFIVGIGGGSPMDAAKAVAIFAANPEMGHSDIYMRTIPAKALPVVLVGTTAGTGSEVTGVSVLTNSDTGRKKSISGADCYARISFCDYGYTMAVPESITVSTALDAFAHAVESFLCRNANELSSLYSIKAFGLLADYICRVNDPLVLNEELREKLYSASVFAGLAINITGTAFPHTVGYYLTENYGVPHGFACAAFMPKLLERAEKNCPDKIGAIEKYLGFSCKELSEVIKDALDFDFNISEEEAVNAARRWENGVANFDRSPGGFNWEEASKALCEI